MCGRRTCTSSCLNTFIRWRERVCMPAGWGGGAVVHCMILLGGSISFKICAPHFFATDREKTNRISLWVIFQDFKTSKGHEIWSGYTQGAQMNPDYLADLLYISSVLPWGTCLVGWCSALVQTRVNHWLSARAKFSLVLRKTQMAYLIP